MKLFSSSKIFIVPALFCGLSGACKRLIEIPANPPTSLPTAQVFADSADALSAVAGIYNDFGVTSSSYNIGSTGIPLSTGLTGDELNISITYDASATQLYNNAIDPQANNYAITLWTSAYKPIYQANACLDGIQNSNTLSLALKNQLNGEIKAARAFLYFNLVNIYGAVPLVLTTDYKVSAVQARTPEDSVYAQIIKDLDDAIALLSTNYPSSGRLRPNLYTAKALLAKVYLYQKNWQMAADLADDIIGSGLYGLVTDLSKVFLDGSNEAIWQLPANGSSSQTRDAATFIPYANSIIPNYYFTDRQMAAFGVNDQRAASWVGTNIAGTQPYYYPYKYKNTYAPFATTEDYMIFRLGELYLIRAEALAQQNKLDSAVADLNQIRSRAGLSPTTATTQISILSAIMQERQAELFCEWGNRWFDLKRTGTIDAALGAYKTGWVSTDALFPIPNQEIQTNSRLQQNPGYH